VELTTDRVPSVELVGVAWVPDDPDADGEPVYFSDVVVRPDSPVADLESLAGLRVGCNDRASLSGFHALRIELGRRGRDPATFAELVMTGGHHHSIDQLLAGELDAAVIDSIVLTRRARQWPEVGALRTLERLGPWPTQPLVIRADAGEDDARVIRKALLAVNEAPEIRELFAASALDRLVEVGPDHCLVVRQAMASL
jgi:phosphonate transport system substrate-binding protein